MAQHRFDPTRTMSLRARFVADVDARFRLLSKWIKTAIVDNDVFGLKPGGSGMMRYFNKESLPGQFDFPRSDAKVEAFMKWLKEAENQSIFEVKKRPGRLGQAIDVRWTDTYIDSAHQAGIRKARAELKKQGIEISDTVMESFNNPIHADRVGVLFSRTFIELVGVSAAMDQSISRVLAEGMINGWGADKIARDIVDRVDKIGRSRAEMIARTEIIRAFHVGNVQEYRNYGVVGVTVQVEWLTAGFVSKKGYDVCPECKKLNGKMFTLDEIEGMIPVHPNCRCTAIPVVIGADGKKI
ncbi:MAG: hypothetical protein BWK76_23095 [Desulfobulbaceae bacterium A2]|nr:MAG: hypothetical protein BWK76_23095 [Desulfobulbaceae bacterium A2]